MRKLIVVIGICILIWSSLGCIDDRESFSGNIVIGHENKFNETKIDYNNDNTIYTGIITNVEYGANNAQSDFIMFQDGLIIPCKHLHEHVVKLNSVNIVTIRTNILDTRRVISIEQQT